jgi:hypothetical protein
MLNSVTLKGSCGCCFSLRKLGFGKIDAQGVCAPIGWDRSIHGPDPGSNRDGGNSIHPFQP